MPISDKLLKILACPEDKTPVRVAETSTIEALNEKIRSGQIKNRGGATVDHIIDGGLIRADGKYLYPIRNDIPVMLIEEAIEVGKL